MEKKNYIDYLFILSRDKSPVFVLKNIDYDIHQYWDFESLLIKSLVLIFGEKIKFYQELDSHTINLKNYGCNDLVLYPIINENFSKMMKNISVNVKDFNSAVKITNL